MISSRAFVLALLSFAAIEFSPRAILAHTNREVALDYRNAESNDSTRNGSNTKRPIGRPADRDNDRPEAPVSSKTASAKSKVKARKLTAAEIAIERLAAPTGEQVLIEAHVGRFATRSIMGYEQPDGDLLVPLMQITTLAGIDARIVSGKLLGRQSKSGPAFSFDVRTRELGHGQKGWRMRPQDIARNKDGLWVSLTLLNKLMGVEIFYDQSSADLEIRDADLFPVGQKALHAATVLAQRSKLNAQKAEPVAPTPVDDKEFSLRSRAFVLDYQVTHNMQPSGLLSSGLPSNNDVEVALGGSFPVFRGVMNVRTNSFNSLRSFSNSLWWTLTRPASKLYSELSVGEVRTRGFQSRVVRGVSITNGSPVPELTAGNTNYSVRLPAEWQLDAFRGSNLISTSAQATGEHVLPVSLLYGTNTIDFVAHGPDGQERSFQRSFHTPSMYVTPNEIDYAVAGGLCEDSSVCLARMNADFRYGVLSNLVVRAGFDGRLGAIKDDPRVPNTISTSALIPYAGVSAVINRSTVVDASIQPAVGSSARSDAAMQVRFEPNPSFILSGDASSISTPLYGSTVAAANTSSDSATQAVWHEWMRSNRASAYMHYAPSFAARHASLEAWSSVQSWNTALSSSSRLGLSAQVKGVQVRPYARFEKKRTAVSGSSVRDAIGDEQALATTTKHISYQGLDLMYVPSWRRAAALGEWWVRGSIEASKATVDNWSAAVTRAFGRWRVDAVLLKRSGLPGRAWTLSLVSELPQLQTSNFSSSATSSSRATSITQVQGSAIYDGELKRLTLSAEPATGRAGVAGVVFLDFNGDGIRQSNETPVADVQLYVNNKSLVSDRNGAFMAWGLPGYATQQILVDTSSLSDPTWIPPQSLTSVKTLAGTLVTVNIPIVTAGTLRGIIRADYSSDVTSLADTAGQRWNAPVRLVLHNSRTGLSRIVDTFSDGSFYEEGVMPGEYQLSVDATSLVGTGLASLPIKTVVRSQRPLNEVEATTESNTPSGELVLWLRCSTGKSSTTEKRCLAK